MPKIPSRHAFSSYLVILIAIGTLILFLTYLRLRPYLSHLDIFSIDLSSTTNTPTLVIVPQISRLTPTSVTITFIPTPDGSQILKLGTKPSQLITSIILPLQSIFQLNQLFPRQRYFFQIDNSPVYSFITPTP